MGINYSDVILGDVFVSTFQYVKCLTILDETERSEILCVLGMMNGNNMDIALQLEKHMQITALLAWLTSKYKDSVERKEVELKRIKDSYVSQLSGLPGKGSVGPMASSSMAQTDPRYINCQSEYLDYKRLHDYLKSLYEVFRDRKEILVQISANQRQELKSL